MKKTIFKLQQTPKLSAVLLMGVGGGIGLAVGFLLATMFFPDNENQDVLKRYSSLSPAVAVADQQDNLVGFQPLRDSLLNAYAKRDDYLVAIYFEYLPTGVNININENERIWPASLIKIPVAMAAMKKVERGDWRLENELVIFDEDKDSQFGDLYREPNGTRISIERLFRESLVNSDNTAHFVFLRNLNNSELEEVFVHLGLNEILETLRLSPASAGLDNRMTVKNYSVFFRSLYNATYLSPEYSQKILQLLLDSPREHLALGLPENTSFAHKTGTRTDNQVWTNSGIVYLPRRQYLLTVMIQEKPGAAQKALDHKALFTAISEEIYNYVANLR